MSEVRTGVAGVTRTLRADGGVELLAVRRARLLVVAGPDAGKHLDLGDSLSAVIGTHPAVELPLSDDTVSRRHAELRAEPDGWRLRDLGSTNGIRIGGARVSDALLDETTRLRLGQSEIELRLLSEEVQHPLSSAEHFGALMGRAPEMRLLFAQAARVAQSDATVLIQGESGTGKELLAEAIHRASPRAARPFIVVDCGSLASGVADSELFGHVAGAFSGADRVRRGLIEDADGGTLFLDEIGELPLDVQPKLLRAIAAQEVRRVGADASRRVDVRIIAATHRDLSRAVAQRRFRADLFFRLGSLKLTLPPLRHRPEDISLLARHFARRLQPSGGAEALLQGPLLRALASYDWPGNARELHNVIERLISVGDLDSRVREAEGGVASSSDDYSAARRQALDRFERAYCERLLESSGGAVGKAAERAGISRQMFHRLMSRHGLVK